jgi:hypothetical protein
MRWGLIILGGAIVVLGLANYFLLHLGAIRHLSLTLTVLGGLLMTIGVVRALIVGRRTTASR